MKPINTWVEIICWHCATHCYGQWVVGREIPVRVFRREAKDRKWRETTGGEFECPKCTQKSLEEFEQRGALTTAARSVL